MPGESGLFFFFFKKKLCFRKASLRQEETLGTDHEAKGRWFWLLARGAGGRSLAWASQRSGSDSSQARKRLHASPSRAETEREAETQTGSRALGMRKAATAAREWVTQTASQPAVVPDNPAGNARFKYQANLLVGAAQTRSVSVGMRFQRAATKQIWLGRRAVSSSQVRSNPGQRDGSTGGSSSSSRWDARPSPPTIRERR